MKLINEIFMNELNKNNSFSYTIKTAALSSLFHTFYAMVKPNVQCGTVNSAT